MRKISANPRKSILIAVIILLVVGISYVGVRLLSSQPTAPPSSPSPTGTKLKPVTYQLSLNDTPPTVALSPTQPPQPTNPPVATPTSPAPTLLAQAPTATVAPTEAPITSPSPTQVESPTVVPSEATSSASAPEAGVAHYTIAVFLLAMAFIIVSFAI